MKRVLAMFITVVMVLSTTVVGAYAEEETFTKKFNEYAYAYEQDKEVQITPYNIVTISNVIREDTSIIKCWDDLKNKFPDYFQYNSVSPSVWVCKSPTTVTINEPDYSFEAYRVQEVNGDLYYMDFDEERGVPVKHESIIATGTTDRQYLEDFGPDAGWSDEGNWTWPEDGNFFTLTEPGVYEINARTMGKDTHMIQYIVIEEKPELIMEQDPAEDLVLPIDKLEVIEDASDAVSAVKGAASTMTTEQKESATGVDKLTVFAEEAAANAVTTEITSDINVTNDVVSDLTTKSDEAKEKVEQAVESSGVELNREIKQNVKFKTKSSTRKTVDFAKDLNLGNIDNVIIESEDYRVSVPAEVIAEEEGLQMTIEEAGEYTGSLDDSILFAAGNNNKTFKISFNKNQLKSNVKVSLPAQSGDTNSQAIVDANGKAVGGKYNPTTGMLEAKINADGTYKVAYNGKDFSDITNKSAEMQEAIKTLAAKGIISGTSETTFSPDKSISRAEIAAIILRTLGKLDANADGKFTDVSKSDWYYGTAGSSKKYGIISGYPDGTFRGRTTIVKEQVIAVSARTLQQEMGYKTPTDTSKYLSRYADSANISDWAKGNAALATRENLVIQRTDSKFAPQENITRGEAALILKKLFDRVW